MLTPKYILKSERLSRVYSGGTAYCPQDKIPEFIVKEVATPDGDVRLEQVRNPDYVSVDVGGLVEKFEKQFGHKFS